MTTLGAIFLPTNPPEALRGIARAADEAGLEELWLWEDSFLAGGVASAAAALAWTTKVKVGIGIFPVPFRNVASLAMDISGLARMFPGRALPGIGHGVQGWMGKIGARPASPLTLLEEYATSLRSLLHGEDLTVSGRYVSLDKVKLDWPPVPAPPVYVAAGGPKTVALAGAVGDGMVLSGGTTPAQVAEAKAAVTATWPYELIVFVPALTGPAAAERLVADAKRFGTTYPGLSGSTKEIAAGVAEFVAAGATKVILQPTPDEDPEGYVRWVAEEVRPLID